MSLCTSADVSQGALRLEIIEEKSAHARTGDSGEASKPPRVDSCWTGFTPKSPRCSAACLALTATASDLGTDDHTHLIIILFPGSRHGASQHETCIFSLPPAGIRLLFLLGFV